VIWALRIAFLLQALLGIGLSRAFLGMRPLGVPSGEGDLHMLVGLIAAGLAIVALKPAPGDTLGSMARFFPLLPLLFGLAIRFGGMDGAPFVLVHIGLGVVAIGLVEITIARQRRAAKAEVAAGP
jgi:hypothetical protein